MVDAPRDENRVPVLMGVSSVDGVTPIPIRVNPATGRLQLEGTVGGVLTTLGDILYHNGSADTRLAGNTTTTKKFLRQTGDGAVSAAPAWDTIVAADLPAPLTSIAGLTTAADKMIYTTASDTYAVADLSAFGRSLIDDAAASNARTTLGLVIGTDVQAFDATLTSIAALGTAADKLAYTTGVDTWAEAALTAFGRSLIDDADAGTARTTLGLGTMSTQASDSVSITGGSVTGITDVTVADGGTGRGTHTAYAVLCGGTTTTAPQQSIAGVGTSGQVLTSNGASALPTFEDSAASDDTIIYAGNIAPKTGPPTGHEDTGNFSVFNMQDAANTSATLSALVPAGRTGISSITVSLLGRGSAGNFYVFFHTSHAAAGQAIEEDTTDTAATYADGSSNRIVTMTVPAAAYNALTNIVAGSVIGLEINRDGADANDTITDALYILSVKIVWS